MHGLWYEATVVTGWGSCGVAVLIPLISAFFALIRYISYQ